MASKLDHALALAAQGFRVFPIKPGAKAPPFLNGWPTKATSDPKEIESFWLAVPNANIGISCDGLLVLDVDVKKGGNESFEKLDTIYGFGNTLTTRTPTGGRHLFFRLPEGVHGSNSVGTLASGIDVRSTGGYVVAPGSIVPAGVYEFEAPAHEIAPAPDWLVAKLATTAAKSETPAAPVADAIPELVERARQWLAGQLPAFEGQGGDAHTFKVVAGLRDMGVSAEQALHLLESWNLTCVPPWAPADLETKVRNVYKYAENEPGTRAAKPEDFPVITVNSSNSVSSTVSRARVMRLADFAGQEARGAGYVIKGLLQKRSYAEAYGAPGEGKTFAVLDMSYHVAAGQPWMGHKVHAGPALYLAFEGTGGLVKRAQALRRKYGDKDVPLYIAAASFSLREPTGRRELGELLAALPEKPVLIVIDTFARALMGGDENSAQDVGAFNNAIGALIESTGACVLIVHHSGKDKTRGARGSSALEAALDTEIQVDAGQIIAHKQRDVETGTPINFKLVPIIVGIDEDGDEATSCVVEPSSAPTIGTLERLQGNAKRGFDILCAIRPTNEPIHALDWREACKEFLGPKSVAQRFYDMKKSLSSKGYIIEDASNIVTRRMI